MRTLLVLVCLAGAGCHALLPLAAPSRDDAGPAGDLAADVVQGDAATPDAPAPDLLASIPSFGTPVLVPGLESIYADGPHLSDDGLRLYFSSGMPGTTGERDIWVATRSTTGMQVSFGAPANLTSLNSVDDESDPSLSADELTIIYERSPASVDDDALLVASRTTRYADFGTPLPVTELNQQGVGDGDPGLTADGLGLYYATNWNKGGWGIWFTTRPGRKASFAAPTFRPELFAGLPNTTSPAPAGGLLFFAADAATLKNLYVTWLTEGGSPPAPQPLAVNLADKNETDPHFNVKQRVLVFRSNRSGPGRLWWCKAQ